jgi:hypothetical protein
MMKLLEKDNRWLKKPVSMLQKHEEKTFDRESVLQGVSNDRGDSLLSSEMRYECAHLEAAKTERNKRFASTIIKAENALSMTSNGGGLKITEKCKIPGYKYLVWYSKKAIRNIICLKNLTKCYRATYDSELDTTFVVHCSAFGLPDLLFEMHRCGVNICYPKKMGEFRAVQTVRDNMKLFSKQQIAGAVQDRDLYEKSMVQARDLYKKIILHQASERL